MCRASLPSPQPLQSFGVWAARQTRSFSATPFPPWCCFLTICSELKVWAARRNHLEITELPARSALVPLPAQGVCLEVDFKLVKALSVEVWACFFVFNKSLGDFSYLHPNDVSPRAWTYWEIPAKIRFIVIQLICAPKGCCCGCIWIMSPCTQGELIYISKPGTCYCY